MHGFCAITDETSALFDMHSDAPNFVTTLLSSNRSFEIGKEDKIFFFGFLALCVTQCKQLKYFLDVSDTSAISLLQYSLIP